ncbi:MAG: hypothetical protein HC828_03410 [Blastochloris sp.]|nr:hypothetical protein [Blastochloris sp.]
MPIPTLSDDMTVRPFLTNRFVGQIAYLGAADIYVAALAVHAEGEAAFLNLVGHDTGVSSITSKLFLGENLEFVPADETDWRGPRVLKRLGGGYRRSSRRLPGLQQIANHMVVPYAMRVQFNAQQAPDVPPELMKKKDAKDGQPDEPDEPKVLTMPEDDAEQKPTWRYIVATEGQMPSYGLFFGTLVGMRVIVLRPRQKQQRDTAHAWANALWRAGQAHNLIQPLHAAGMSMWAIRESVLHWNALVSQGVAERWLPMPASTTESFVLPAAHAVAAD